MALFRPFSFINLFEIENMPQDTIGKLTEHVTDIKDKEIRIQAEKVTSYTCCVHILGGEYYYRTQVF